MQTWATSLVLKTNTQAPPSHLPHRPLPAALTAAPSSSSLSAPSLEGGEPAGVSETCGLCYLQNRAQPAARRSPCQQTRHLCQRTLCKGSLSAGSLWSLPQSPQVGQGVQWAWNHCPGCGGCGAAVPGTGSGQQHRGEVSSPKFCLVWAESQLVAFQWSPCQPRTPVQISCPPSERP